MKTSTEKGIGSFGYAEIVCMCGCKLSADSLSMSWDRCKDHGTDSGLVDKAGEVEGLFSFVLRAAFYPPQQWEDRMKTSFEKITVLDQHGNYLCETYSTYDARLFKNADRLLFALKNLLMAKNGVGGAKFNSDKIAQDAIASVEGR